MSAVRITQCTMHVESIDQEVSTILVEPRNPIALMVLGHGAGTPIHSSQMEELAEALAILQVATFRYNYPYSENMTAYYSGIVDPVDVLIATVTSAKSAAEALLPDLPLFLGGRSMSSQVVSLAMAREEIPNVSGIVLYVYPTRWAELLDDPVSHLERVSSPALFVQAGCDQEYDDLDELQPVLNGLGGQVSLHVVAGADHFYNLPRDSGRTRIDALSEVAAVTARWMRNQLR